MKVPKRHVLIYRNCSGFIMFSSLSTLMHFVALKLFKPFILWNLLIPWNYTDYCVVIVLVFPTGGHGNDKYLQTAEVPACAEWFQSLNNLCSSLCDRLPAEDVHSSYRKSLPEHPSWRTQAVALISTDFMKLVKTMHKERQKLALLFAALYVSWKPVSLYSDNLLRLE